MSNIAILGHPTRGREVIQLLKMLGGENKYSAQGNSPEVLYFINDNKGIKYLMESDARTDLMKVFTLEEFEKLYPYKVGDKVITKDKFIGTITDIRWQGDSFFVGKEEGDIVYTVQVSTTGQITYPKEDLQPYKEEDMEGVYAYNEINCYHQDFGDKVRIRLGNDFEIKVEDNITYIVKKQSQYPKTYEECEASGFSSNPVIVAMAQGVCMNSFAKLIVIRNTYWEIAGKKMGLGKPWEPDWEDEYETYYTISYDGVNIKCYNDTDVYSKLAFPTPEMRDVFYENFKKLIEQCKELL